MNGIMKENQLTIVIEYELIKPNVHKIDSKFEKNIRYCHNKSFRTFEYKCAYDIKFTIIGNNEKVVLAISDKSMNLYRLKKK